MSNVKPSSDGSDSYVKKLTLHPPNIQTFRIEWKLHAKEKFGTNASAVTTGKEPKFRFAHDAGINADDPCYAEYRKAEIKAKIEYQKAKPKCLVI